MTREPDEAAFRRMYDRHHGSVLCYFLRRTDRETALEGTIDVFLVAWRRFDRVPEGDDALPWLYGVARRVHANQRRSFARRFRLGRRLLRTALDTPEDPETQVVRRSEDEEVLAAIAALPERDQEVIRLAYWEEMPHREIGAILGCSAGAVDVRLHRAVRRLEKGLGPTGQKTGKRQAALSGEEQA